VVLDVSRLTAAIPGSVSGWQGSAGLGQNRCEISVPRAITERITRGGWTACGSPAPTPFRASAESHPPAYPSRRPPWPVLITGPRRRDL